MVTTATTTTTTATTTTATTTTATTTAATAATTTATTADYSCFFTMLPQKRLCTFVSTSIYCRKTVFI